MSSKREAVVEAFVAALGAVGKPAGLSVHRFRARPIGVDELPAQLVYLVSEIVETGPDGSHYIAIRRCTVRVETRVAVVDPTTTAPDTAVDPYLSWAVKQLCADPTLGGTVADVWERSTEWAAADQDKVYAAAQTDFEVLFGTPANNPDA